MIDELKKGNAETFEQAYNQYCHKVYSYFKKKTECAEDAQDLMQTSFLKLWQYRSSLSSAYLLDQHLFHIAKTVFIDYLRKQHKIDQVKKELLLKSNQPADINPSLSYSLASQVTSILSSMPPLRRQVFELNRVQGYSYKEVAELLSISVKAVDNNLAKALKQLRTQVVISLMFFICIGQFL
jgi:RNA polymerase sigma factor (sigma-70 family)